MSNDSNNRLPLLRPGRECDHRPHLQRLIASRHTPPLCGQSGRRMRGQPDDHSRSDSKFGAAGSEPVYGIDDFPDDDSLWRVEWIGGVGHNTSVPSDPRITVCLTQLPPGETNPLSARARSWQTKTTAKISVGLLAYISIVSVWQ